MPDNPCISAAEQIQLFESDNLSRQEMLEQIAFGMDEITARKRYVMLQGAKLQQQKEALDEILGPDVKDRGRVAKNYVQSILAPSQNPNSKYAKYNRSIETEAEAIKREIYAPLAEGLERFRTPMLDRIMLRTANASDNENLIRAIKDGATDDPDAAAFASLWGEASEALRREFNAMGGNIAKRHNWDLPQSHNPGKMTKVGKSLDESFEQWLKDIEPMLDKDEMDIKDEDFADVAKRVYDRIVTDGTVDIEPGKIPKGAVGAIAKRHQERRFFQFKDGDAWLEYAKKYGNNDSVMETITNHIEHMAHEIAMMRALGPNPENMFKYLRDVVEKEGGRLGRLDNMWANISGKTAARGKYGRNVYEGGQIIRNWHVATKLPSAFLSATADVVFSPLTHFYNGTWKGRTWFDPVRHLKPSSAKDRIRATQLANSADYALAHISSASRFSEVNMLGVSGKIADLTMRLSFLNPWTHARKRLFELDTRRALAEAPADYESLKPGMKDMLARYGIEPEDWPTIHKAQEDLVSGADTGNDMILNPLRIEELDLRRRMLALFHEESRYATPEPGVRTRATLNQGLQKGTIPGEGLAFVAAFKSFPVTMIQTHWQRMWNTPGLKKYQYLAGLLAGTTILGTFSYQMKRIASGKEPLPADDPEQLRKLVLAGFVKGGGGGILADFVFADHNRYGASLAGTLGGPLYSDLDRYLRHYLLGSFSHATNLENEKMMDRLRRLPGAIVKDYTPGQLWYIKLLLQRGFFDEFHKLMDPKYQEHMQKYDQRMRKQEGSGYYSLPGSGVGSIFEGLAP